MAQQFPPSAGPSGSWPRVIVNTIRLALQRRRLRATTTEDPGSRFRVVLATAVGVGVVGIGLLALSMAGRDSPPAAVRPSTATIPHAGSPEPTSQLSSAAGAFANRSQQPTSPARAAAGAEIAARDDTDVSAAAATVLRSGEVDGRVLVVLASLAAAGQLAAVDVPRDEDARDAAAVELGVVDVDTVLGWLDTQPRLKPDHLEVRRDDSLSYLLLAYDSPEPPGLFPS